MWQDHPTIKIFHFLFVSFTEHHHSKAAAAALTPITPHHPVPSTFSLLSGSQSGMSSTSNKGILFATIPHITSIESFKGTGIRVSTCYILHLIWSVGERYFIGMNSKKLCGQYTRMTHIIRLLVWLGNLVSMPSLLKESASSLILYECT